MSKIVAAVAIAAVGGAGVVGTGIALSPGAESEAKVTVVRVVDGDTVDVLNDGTRERVRLLNVDAPETKHPDRPVECLGPEAAAYLARLLPRGASVTLEHDVERQDRYGRTLAGVRLDDGQLTSALLARQGLGVPVVFGKNRKFYPEVVSAYREAATNRVGYFGEGSACTIPSRMSRAESTVGEATTRSTASTGDAQKATTVVMALQRDLTAQTPALEVRALRPSDVTEVRRRVTVLAGRLKNAAKTTRPASTKRSAEKAGRTGVGAPKRSAATPRARAEDPHKSVPQHPAATPTRQAPRATSRPQAPKVTPRPQTPKITPRPQAPKPRPSNAAPCRSYAPGGKTWKPIPCP